MKRDTRRLADRGMRHPVVRSGHYRGAPAGGRALRSALALLMEAVPPPNTERSTATT